MNRRLGELAVGEQHVGAQLLGARRGGEELHRVQCGCVVLRIGRVAVQQVGEAGEGCVLLHRARRVPEHAHGADGCRSAAEAPARILEADEDEAHRRARRGEVVPLARRAVQRKVRLSHRERVIEERAAIVVLIVTEAPARE